MNILMMTNTYLSTLGGLEKSIQAFSDQFRRWGHRVGIVVPEAESGVHEKDMFPIPVLSEVHRSGLALNLPLPSSLSHVIDTFQPDVIHAHYPFLIGEIALRAAIKYEKPLIYTHHILFEAYTHYLPLPPLRAKRFLIELSSGYANLATHVIAPSQGVKESLEKEGVKTPITVVPTGVDIERFHQGDGSKIRRRLGVAPDAFVVGYVGRLAKEKNLDFLAEALISFLTNHPKAHFVAAGIGPYEEDVKQKFLAAKLENQIHFLGKLQEQELIDCYHSFDVFAFASKSETQGIVLVEAMASGVPVAALDAPGVREIVTDFENGCLVLEEDVSLFEKALVRVMNQEGYELAALKQRAQATAEKFSLESCAEEAIEVYQSAINQVELNPYGKNKWRRSFRRLIGEWRLFANFGRATGHALVLNGTEDERK